MSKVVFIAPELWRVERAEVSTLALFVFRGLKPLAGINSLVDWRLHGHLSRLIIDGFFDADRETPLLIPLGRRLPQKHLLVVGLGERTEFDESVFRAAIEQMFEKVRGLGNRDIALALPGRAEGVTESNKAMEWFMECYDRFGDGQSITLIEPPTAQKAMLPELERWRLRQLVP